MLAAGSTIGIIGGGQLGRMLAMAAARLGYRIIVLEPQADCPAAQVANRQIVAAYDSPDGLRELTADSDIITYEFENVPVAAARQLQETTPVFPPPLALEVAQDRVTEKRFLNDAGIATAPWQVIDSAEDLSAALRAFDGKGILKTRRLGYDGKGQQLLKSTDDLPLAKDLFTHSQCIAEGFVPFVKEVSVIVQRNGHGESYCQPVGENIHVHHILHETIVPARISESTAQAAEREALKIADYGYVMETGKIIIEGNASELIVDPRIVEAYLGRKSTSVEEREKELT